MAALPFLNKHNNIEMLILHQHNNYPFLYKTQIIKIFTFWAVLLWAALHLMSFLSVYFSTNWIIWKTDSYRLILPSPPSPSTHRPSANTTTHTTVHSQSHFVTSDRYLSIPRYWSRDNHLLAPIVFYHI